MRETPMTYQMEIYMYKGANHPRLSEGPIYGFTEVLKKTWKFVMEVPIVVSRKI
jgi:hypothetical protein